MIVALIVADKFWLLLRACKLFMEDTETSGVADMGDNFPSPDYDFSSGEESSGGAGQQEGKVDLTVTKFAPIEKFFSDTPHKVFDDPNYYKTALSGESYRPFRVQI